MNALLRYALPRTAPALIAIAASAAMAAGTPPMYRIEKVKRDETGQLKAHSAESINNDGVVVGWSRVNFDYHPYLLDGKRPRQMEGPPAPAMYQGPRINIRSEVVGAIYFNAYYWDSDGHATNLNPLVPCSGDKSSVGKGINDLGAMVGTYSCTSGSGSWIYRDGLMADLGTLGSDNQVEGINSAGQVVGASGTIVNGKAVTHAYLWQDGAIQDLGTLGEDNSEALAINEAGYVVGRSYSSSFPVSSQGFVYKDGTMKPLPTCAGNTMTPRSINNHGQVVGNFRIRNNTTAVLIHKGQCYFLAALLDDSGEGWRDLFVYDINDNGVIVGDGSKGAFIATPLK